MYKNHLEGLFKVETHQKTDSPSLPWGKEAIADAGGPLSTLSNIP